MTDIKSLQEELSRFREQNKSTLGSSRSVQLVTNNNRNSVNGRGWFNELRRRMFRINMDDRQPLIEAEQNEQSIGRTIQSDDDESDIPDEARNRPPAISWSLLIKFSTSIG